MVLSEMTVSAPDEDDDVTIQFYGNTYNNAIFYLSEREAKKLRELLKKAWKK
jgi:hypothetical protein